MFGIVANLYERCRSGGKRKWEGEKISEVEAVSRFQMAFKSAVSVQEKYDRCIRQ
jgi:hypothetical protein